MTESRWLDRSAALCTNFVRVFDFHGEWEVIALESGLHAVARADRSRAVVLGHPLWPQEPQFHSELTAESIVELQFDHGIPATEVIVSDLYSLEFRPYEIWAQLQ